MRREEDLMKRKAEVEALRLEKERERLKYVAGFGSALPCFGICKVFCRLERERLEQERMALERQKHREQELLLRDRKRREEEERRHR